MPSSRLKTFGVDGRASASALRAVLQASVSEENAHLALAEHIRRRVRAGVEWTHIPAGEKRPPGVGGKLKGMGVNPGWPDFIFLASRVLYGLELKKVGGTLSRDQERRLPALEAAGMIVAVVFDIDRALTQLTEWKLIR